MSAMSAGHDIEHALGKKVASRKEIHMHQNTGKSLRKPHKTLTFRVLSKNGQSRLRKEGVAWRHCKMASQKSETRQQRLCKILNSRKMYVKPARDDRISPRQCAFFMHLPALSSVFQRFHAFSCIACASTVGTSHFASSASPTSRGRDALPRIDQYLRRAPYHHSA